MIKGTFTIEFKFQMHWHWNGEWEQGMELCKPGYIRILLQHDGNGTIVLYNENKCQQGAFPLKSIKSIKWAEIAQTEEGEE